MWETVFTGQKTQPTVSKHWRDTYSTPITEKHNNRTINTKQNKSPSLQWYGVTRGQLPLMADLLGLNGGGAAAAVPPGSNGLSIGNGIWAIEWSHDRWRHLTLKGQTRDPNTLKRNISKTTRVRGLNLVGDFVLGMPSRRTNNFPEMGVA